MNLAYNSDKRRYVRYELLDYAAMSLNDGQDSVNIVITDIGLGGIQIRSKSELISGTRCLIHVACMDGTNLQLRGEIRHATTVNNSELYSAGVRFVPDSHGERMAVAEFVHQVFQRQADDLAS